MDGSSGFPLQPSYRGTLTGEGRPGPIEERIGRRLVRLVDPESVEGIGLLEAGRVEITGPDGEVLGPLRPADAYRRLLARLNQRIGESHSARARSELKEGLDRLKVWSERLKAPR